MWWSTRSVMPLLLSDPRASFRRLPRRQPPFPFLKWAGGKRALVASILERMPARFEVYVEPFLGGGAAFLELAKQGRFERAILADRNEELIGLWRAVRDDVEAVMEAASRWPYDRDFFYRLRDAPEDLVEGEFEWAARTLYLNKTCFNGLYRRNKSKRFNVPFGSYHKAPRVVDEGNLRRCSEVLQGVELIGGIDFEEVLADAGPGWVAYCDPPYWPVSRTANFTSYDGFVFTADDQRRLARSFRDLAERGAVGVLSNSSTPATRELYDGLDVGRVQARRSINRDGKGRGPVEELLVSTR